MPNRLKTWRKIVVKLDTKSGTPILIKNIASVSLGPDIRRGELDGKGDCVGGIVVIRHSESALAVIERVKEN